MKAIDASVAVKLVAPEPDSAKAHALWNDWTAHGEDVVAPALFLAECCSAVRLKVHRAQLDDLAGEQALAGLLGLEIDIVEPAGLYEHAWALARELNQPVIYDCLYLALAESLGCEVWTADEALARVARPRFPWVRTLGEYATPTS